MLPTKCVFEIVEKRVKVNLHLHVGSVQECPSFRKTYFFVTFVHLGKRTMIEIRSLDSLYSTSLRKYIVAAQVAVKRKTFLTNNL